jgi:hypothetical protein
MGVSQEFVVGNGNPSFVMAGLDPAIHEAVQHAERYDYARGRSSWIAGSSPAMTRGESRAAPHRQ